MGALIARLDYVVAVILFCVGLYALIMKTNLIKKIIGLNIVETSVYFFFIAMGDVRLGVTTSEWAMAPFAGNVKDAVAGLEVMVNPIPSALILTAIVVSVSVTSVALGIVIKLYQHYGTLDTRKMIKLRG